MLRNSMLAFCAKFSVLVGLIVATCVDHNYAQETLKLTNGKGEILEVAVGDDDKEHDDRIAVDVAVLLDTSNSMDGLINQARNQLWQIVQRLAVAEKDGRKPALRVSVFEYGNTNLPATENYIRQVLPLSDDLDKVSEALFSLTTQGGDEYCGAVIGEAIQRLDWSRDVEAYRSIFIAGNEAFTQGQVSYISTCADAREKQIIVNTIHCGDHSAGVKGMWADGAERGAGQSFNINQDQKQVTIKCPQDKVLIELNSKLNKTYLWFGSKSQRDLFCENQAVQDTNAMGGGGMAMPSASFSRRASAKVSGIYDNRRRDLVDAERADAEALEKLDTAKLPDEMQGMTGEERKKYVADKAAQRKKIQDEIKQVAKERDAYIAAKRKKLGESKDTFGDAICLAIDKQLAEKGFKSSSR